MASLARGLLDPIIMKIAVSHWHGRIAPVFDVAENLLLIDIEGGRKLRQENVSLSGNRDSFGRAHDVSGLGVNVLLCGAVSHTLETALIGSGVQVFGFLCGDLEDVTEAFLLNGLTDECYFMPGHQAKQRLNGIRRNRAAVSKRSSQQHFSKDKQKGGH